MADNEKLDNQRLKNFKNKGRDLEVKQFTGWRRAARIFLPHHSSRRPWLPVTYFVISTIGIYAGTRQSELSRSSFTVRVSPWFFTPSDCPGPGHVRVNAFPTGWTVLAAASQAPGNMLTVDSLNQANSNVCMRTDSRLGSMFPLVSFIFIRRVVLRGCSLSFWHRS